MPVSQARSGERVASYPERPRHALTKTCCVTSSASVASRSERSASVCTNADQRR
jgi:hypothetical protein